MRSINKAYLVGSMLFILSAFGVQADERVPMQSVSPEEGATAVQLARHHNPCGMHNPCNPCAKKGNPCGMKGNPCNPCAMKGNPCNPCGMKGNPCGMRGNPCNPCGMKGNPCGMRGNPCNPCAGGAKMNAAAITPPADHEPYKKRNSRRLVRQGEELWNDTSLSTNGMSCNSCHVGGASFNKTYKDPYPHRVAMATNQFGVKGPITAEQMVQMCMVVPMAGKPLPWDSKELSALRAYIEEESQPAFAKKVAANPCAMRGGANPCNPCAMKGNPCAMKNPCNPCAMKGNPCAMKRNPCAGR